MSRWSWFGFCEQVSRGGSRILCSRMHQPEGRGGRQHIIFLDFPKRCMKLRTFLSVGAEGGLSGASPCTLPIRHWSAQNLNQTYWQQNKTNTSGGSRISKGTPTPKGNTKLLFCILFAENYLKMKTISLAVLSPYIPAMYWHFQEESFSPPWICVLQVVVLRH